MDPLRPAPPRSWRDELPALIERLRASWPMVVGAVVVVGVVTYLAWSTLSPSTAAPPEATLPFASTTVASRPSTTAPAAELVVQAAGAVAHPGVYRLATGARVDDLVATAGGLTPDADPDAVNLAAPLTDGERVYVPKVGETPPPSASSTGGGSTSSPSPSSPLDLNTATVEQLDSLPGVGPAIAQAIVDYRTSHGRFSAIDDLLDVRGIGPAKLDEIRSLVRV